MRSGCLRRIQGSDRRVTMSSERFYSDVPVQDDFRAVSRLGSYAQAPADWHVAVADVQGSTDAVRAGRYKDVNLLGASCIMAVLNATRPVEIPYVFGGDGASLCVPPSLLEATRSALRATRALAKREFGLQLRESRMVSGLNWNAIVDWAAQTVDPSEPLQKEFLSLVQQAKAIYTKKKKKKDWPLGIGNKQ